MSQFSGPPDSYWEPPEPSWQDQYEAAEQDLDMLVAEWADGAEVEVYAEVRGMTEPVFAVTSVRRDGEQLYGGDGFPVEFDTLDQLRAWLQARVPLPPPES